MQIDIKKFTWQIIINPNALLLRNEKFLQHIENRLKELKINYLFHITSTISDAKRLIINFCKNEERHFIVAGGDGTLNIFVNAVMKSQTDSSEIFVAFIPLGTGNDWSRSHEYSKNYLDVIDSFVIGNFIKHDIGLVETVINNIVIDERYFVNIAGFGFDGTVISNARKKPSKIFHKQLYLINLLKTLIKYKSQLITIKSDEFNFTKNVFTIAAGIGQYNGNGMRQCPDAIHNDGLFDVVIIEKVSVLKVLRNINNLFKGTHVKKLKEVSMYRTDYLEINTEPFVMGEVEGEVLTAGNYRIRCLGSKINFMCVKQ